ncbi:Na+/H+ antiporter subunit C [Rubrobacter taiwanensis]|jgi:multicomponent Na+:H+ antiporter subunit C|uniref:Na+/H+ antiporter subunit C n=1 Tax=Rubrobacter taiwanensis TaxID=185139 RepID=A0A4R1BPZ6_9ACTN|nr:NADH-quinone oxidoreductase subunit K [Rubrobacter taiwanensis]TCJ19740.1 Na+/H+ antiporter subunit C [Rubrobacter taiwanensis]
MILVSALTIAVLFGVGSYLLLQRDLIRVVVGIILVSNAANLFLISAGLSRGQAPIYPLEEGVEVSDPLVQAMTLTAIVIAFGISALLMSLVYRVYTSHLSLNLEDISEAEVREEESIESREVAED